MSAGSTFLVKLCNIVTMVIVALCLLYILYSGITATYDWALLLAVLVVLAEGTALLLNRGCCPFAAKAKEGNNSSGLPRCSRSLFWLYVALFAIGIVLLLVRYFA